MSCLGTKKEWIKIKYAKRYKVKNQSKDHDMFQRTAERTEKKNITRKLPRGGYRL